jgi:hypothetical protein
MLSGKELEKELRIRSFRIRLFRPLLHSPLSFSLRGGPVLEPDVCLGKRG